MNIKLQTCHQLLDWSKYVFIMYKKKSKLQVLLDVNFSALRFDRVFNFITNLNLKAMTNHWVRKTQFSVKLGETRFTSV